MSEEQATPRRKMAPEVEERRAERKLVAPFRDQVAELQSRVAFIAGRAITRRPDDRSSLDAEYDLVRQEIHHLLDEIDRVLTVPSLGPADDCRRALKMLLQRLP